MPSRGKVLQHFASHWMFLCLSVRLLLTTEFWPAYLMLPLDGRRFWRL